MNLMSAIAISLLLLFGSIVSQKVSVEHLAPGTPSFTFQNVPSASRDDAATHAKVAVVVGRPDTNAAPVASLVDGKLPGGEDEPGANFFFGAGTDGGRIRIDLGEVIEVAQVNSYSWHRDSRGPQVYNLYASDGTDPKFNASPDEKTHPANVGWKLIAEIDTRPKDGKPGGQYGVSISDPSGSLGKCRYLLIDTVPTEYEDPFGNTFFSEFDVIAKR
jgi:hypothetical protein